MCLERSGIVDSATGLQCNPSARLEKDVIEDVLHKLEDPDLLKGRKAR